MKIKETIFGVALMAILSISGGHIADGYLNPNDGDYFYTLSGNKYEAYKGMWYAVRYVTVSGAGAHNGTNEANAWTLAEGLANDASGDIINWKAGNYGNQNISTFASGSIWRGYITTPGDINNTTYVYPAAVNTALFPTITGSSGTSGTAITGSPTGFTLENVQITNISIGTILGGSGNTIRNVIYHTLGNPTTTASEPSNYNGFGLRVTGNSNTIDHVIVVNATAEAISIQGDDNEIVDCHVYSNVTEAQNGTDYYIMVTGGDDNTISTSTVNRFNETAAGRHGFVIKTSGTGNVFQNSVANDVNIEASFVAVTGNTWRDIIVNGTWSDGDSDVAARLRIANGAHHNYFINITFDDVYCGISFADWDDGAVGPGNSAAEIGGGNDNYIINPIVKNSEIGIMFDEFQNLTAAEDNLIIGGTFYNCNYLFRSQSQNTGTMLINSIVHDVNNFLTQGSGNRVLNTNTVIRNVNVTGGFAASAMNAYADSEITTTSFSFVNAAGGNFKLTSDVLNVGENPNTLIAAAGVDFEGETRTSPYTLGAFVYVDGSPPDPTCFDGIMNGDETGVDCGGSCDPCGTPVSSTTIGNRRRIIFN